MVIEVLKHGLHMNSTLVRSSPESRHHAVISSFDLGRNGVPGLSPRAIHVQIFSRIFGHVAFRSIVDRDWSGLNFCLFSYFPKNQNFTVATAVVGPYRDHPSALELKTCWKNNTYVIDKFAPLDFVWFFGVPVVLAKRENLLLAKIEAQRFEDALKNRVGNEAWAELVEITHEFGHADPIDQDVVRNTVDQLLQVRLGNRRDFLWNKILINLMIRIILTWK